MAGLNQTLMLALSMVVIAALIGAGGLGLVVSTGLGRLDVGGATAGGLGIVILAIVLDHITQGLGEGTGTEPSRCAESSPITSGCGASVPQRRRTRPAGLSDGSRPAKSHHISD